MHFGKIDIIFVPHLTIMYILIMTVYRGFGVAMSLAFFGIVTDLYFGSIYGLYMFGYIILVVIVDKFLKSFIEIILYYFYHFIIHNVLEVYVAMIYGVIGFIKFNLIEFVLLRLIQLSSLIFITDYVISYYY